MRLERWIGMGCVVAALSALAVPAARAHSGLAFAQQPEVKFRLEKLSENAYALFGRGGNIGFVVTPEGILVIDDQFENLADRIVDEIRTVSDRPIRFLVNTHYHGDHTGGNPAFGRFALIVAHDNVRTRLLGQPAVTLREAPVEIEKIDRLLAGSGDASEKFLEFLKGKKRFLQYRLDGAKDFDPAAAAPPILTFSERVQVHLGKERVQLFHFERGHTDGDTLVYLPDQKVLHMGDLFVNGNYPFIDRAGGGHAGEWVETIDRILEIVPGDVKVIPGHGPIGTRRDLEYFRDFLADLRRKVGGAVRAGRSRREAIESIGMEKYDRIKPGFMKLENNVDVVYDEFAEGD